QRLIGRHPHDVEAHRLLATATHADHRLRGVVQRVALRRLEGEAELGVQEAPATDKALAGVLAVDQLVDRSEISVALTALLARRGELPGNGPGVLDALGRRRMRRQEILAARIETAAA